MLAPMPRRTPRPASSRQRRNHPFCLAGSRCRLLPSLVLSDTPSAFSSFFFCQKQALQVEGALSRYFERWCCPKGGWWQDWCCKGPWNPRTRRFSCWHSAFGRHEYPMALLAVYDGRGWQGQSGTVRDRDRDGDRDGGGIDSKNGLQVCVGWREVPE